MIEVQEKTFVRFTVLGTAADYDRATHDQANEIVTMALHEAGFPEAHGIWDGYRYLQSGNVPTWAHYRAARLACDALGIPYRIEGQQEGGSQDDGR